MAVRSDLQSDRIEPADLQSASILLPLANSFWQKMLPITNIYADLPDSYIFADDIESPVDSKLPLWMLGFLY